MDSPPSGHIHCSSIAAHGDLLQVVPMGYNVLINRLITNIIIEFYYMVSGVMDIMDIVLLICLLLPACFPLYAK